jgi:hypothetical protein
MRLRAVLRASQADHSSEWLSHISGQMAGCSGLEAQMNFGEVKIRR